MAKPSIHFNKNMHFGRSRHIASQAGLKRAPTNLKYLGLPLITGGSKQAAFADVVERVKDRLKGWKTKVLYQAARGT